MLSMALMRSFQIRKLVDIRSYRRYVLLALRPFKRLTILYIGVFVYSMAYGTAVKVVSLDARKELLRDDSPTDV